MAHPLHHPSLLLSIPSPSICLNICTLSFSSSLLFHSHTVTPSSSHPIQSIFFFLISLSISSHVFPSFSFLTGFLFVYILLCSFCPFLFFHAKFLRFFCRRKLLDTLHFPSFFSYHGLSCFAMVEAKSAGTPLSKHRPCPRPQEISQCSRRNSSFLRLLAISLSIL